MNYNIRHLLPIDEPQSESDPIRLVLIGSRSHITETIHTLHHLGFAEAGAWSAIVPVPDSSDAMALLKRPRST